MGGGTFKIYSERQIFKNFFMWFFSYSQSFSQFCMYASIRAWLSLNPSLTSNKPTTSCACATMYHIYYKVTLTNVSVPPVIYVFEIALEAIKKTADFHLDSKYPSSKGQFSHPLRLSHFLQSVHVLEVIFSKWRN